MRAVNDSTAGGPIVLFDLDDTLMAHRAAVDAGIVLHMAERAYAGRAGSCAAALARPRRRALPRLPRRPADVRGAAPSESARLRPRPRRRARRPRRRRLVRPLLRAIPRVVVTARRRAAGARRARRGVAGCAIRHHHERRTRLPAGQARAARHHRPVRPRHRVGRCRHHQTRPRHLRACDGAVRVRRARHGGGLCRRPPRHRCHRCCHGRALGRVAESHGRGPWPTTKPLRRRSSASSRSRRSPSSRRSSPSTSPPEDWGPGHAPDGDGTGRAHPHAPDLSSYRTCLATRCRARFEPTTRARHCVDVSAAGDGRLEHDAVALGEQVAGRLHLCATALGVPTRARLRRPRRARRAAARSTCR